MTLNEIYLYANQILNQELSDLSDIIDYLNEAQDYIASEDPIQATPVEIELDEDHEIQMPADLWRLHRMTIDDVDYLPSEASWAGVLVLPDAYTEGTVKIWYYRAPATLSADSPDQVPDVPVRYHRHLATYAAKMYHLVDDDQALKMAFLEEFVTGIQLMKSNVGGVSPMLFRNY